MEKFVEFMAKNYILLIIISLFLIFALVGYFVKRKQNGGNLDLDERVDAAIDFSNIQVDGSLSLKEMVNKGVTVGDGSSFDQTTDQLPTSQDNNQGTSQDNN